MVSAGLIGICLLISIYFIIYLKGRCVKDVVLEANNQWDEKCNNNSAFKIESEIYFSQLWNILQLKYRCPNYLLRIKQNINKKIVRNWVTCQILHHASANLLLNQLFKSNFSNFLTQKGFSYGTCIFSLRIRSRFHKLLYSLFGSTYSSS